MNRIQTKALVEGAVFATITVIIGIIRFYVPIVSLISVIWSVPTILIAFRHGFKVSINSVIVSSILVAVMTQPIQGLGFFLGFGLPGIIMGYLLKKQLSPWKTIFITSVVFAVSSVVSVYLGMLVIGVDILNAYDKIFIDIKNAYSEASNSMANMMGMSSKDMLEGTARFEKSMEVVKLILPGGVLASGIIISFINFKLTKLVLKRINYFISDVKPFSLWRLSNKWMVLVMSVLIYATVEIYLIKLPQLHALTMNIFTITTLVLMVLGLSVIKFFLDKYMASKAAKAIIILLLLAFVGNITMFIGILDMLFDFRKLQNKPESHLVS